LRLLVAAFALALTGCSVELQHDLSEDDANDIYVLLQSKGIEAKKLKEEGGNEPKYIISVAKADVATAAQALRDYALPRPKFDGLGVFKKMKGMIPTQTEERAMFIEALGGEVSNALNQIPGVLEARCIVMIPEVNDLTQPDKKPMPSASVFIKYRSADGKIPFDENAIKAFVATAVPELKKEAISLFTALAVKPADEIGGDEAIRTVSIMGMTMTKGSADTFKVMVAVSALLTLAMAALTVFAFTRKPANGNRPPQRTKTNTPPPAEG
jgi:type III secretion protein J